MQWRRTKSENQYPASAVDAVARPPDSFSGRRSLFSKLQEVTAAEGPQLRPLEAAASTDWSLGGYKGPDPSHQFGTILKHYLLAPEWSHGIGWSLCCNHRAIQLFLPSPASFPGVVPQNIKQKNRQWMQSSLSESVSWRILSMLVADRRHPESRLKDEILQPDQLVGEEVWIAFHASSNATAKTFTSREMGKDTSCRKFTDR